MDSEKIWYQRIRFDSRDGRLENLVAAKCIVSLDLRLLVSLLVSGGPFWSLHESFIGLSKAIFQNWHHLGGRGGRRSPALPNDRRDPSGQGGWSVGIPAPTGPPPASRPHQYGQLKALQEI